MIHKFLAYLKEQTIDYAIISGYKELFLKEKIDSDVDILLKKEEFANVVSIVKHFCVLQDFQIVQVYNQEVYAKNIFIFDPQKNQLLNLDIYGRLHRKETVFSSEAILFESRSLYRGISILDTPHEFIHYLIKKIDKEQISEITFKYLSNLYNLASADCRQKIQNYFTNYSEIIVKAFEADNKILIIENLKALQLDIKVDRKVTLIYVMKNKLRFLRRILFPTGVAICFLGPDGSGKSTIIKGLENAILPFRKTAYFHLKPINTKSSSINNITATPHKYPPYTKLKSYIKLFYFMYQYNLGWLKNIVTLKIRSSLVIFDRYYDDLLADPKRYRYGGTKKIAQFVRLFIPKPILYFVLIADAETIYSRKKEVTFGELEHQLGEYKSLTNKKQYYYINVNRPPEIIIEEVYTILMKRMHERF